MFRRPVFFFVSALLVAGGLGFGVDSVAASRAESHISDEVAASHPGTVLPRVTAKGFPFLVHAHRGELSEIQVRLVDADTGRLGRVSVTTTAYNVSGPAAAVRAGEVEQLHAERVTRSVSIDAAAIGNLLGMQDMDISNPVDISPAAAPRPEALMSGTPAGCDSPATVLVELRVRGQEVVIDPASVVTMPQCRTWDGADPAQVLSRFSWAASEDDLPVVGNVNRLVVRGGSLFLDSEATKVQLSPQLFSVDPSAPRDARP